MKVGKADIGILSGLCDVHAITFFQQSPAAALLLCEGVTCRELLLSGYTQLREQSRSHGTGWPPTITGLIRVLIQLSFKNNMYSP